MNVRIFGFSVLLAFGFVAAAAFGGSGGGSGHPITPYPDGKPTLEAINTQRAKPIFFGDVALSVKPRESFSKADLCFAKAGKCSGPIVRAFSGKDAQDSPVTVALADVRSVRLLKVVDRGKRGAIVSVEIEMFPDITPEDLLRDKPSYSALRSKKVRISVALERADGARLAFGPLPCCSEDRAVGLEEVQIDSAITAEPQWEEYWYAVNSVTSDPSFPYRAVSKK
ncbi:MAG TPA: hypothetical protein VHC69_31825 [Polyangiaceae bacterium]|nr:hypothetical protein [Polyangiaceae bacterium]HVY89561.1 hypothetical protein [Hyphomonadaceae bacterium]